MEKGVKIFLSYHKPCKLLNDDVFTPIHVGRKRAIKNDDYYWMCNNMIGDDTGDNISEKNLNYCELTAQYWAWKNVDCEYVGFMHYRRHLNFLLDKEYDEDKWGVLRESFFNDYYIDKYCLKANFVKNLVKEFDIITVKPWNVKNANSENNYGHYKNSDNKLHIKDYEVAMDVLLKKYPEFKCDVESYNSSEWGYYTNIFVMKIDIFRKYCEWLFGILFEVEKKLDISNYDFQEGRVFGYISEWLFGIYLTHLKRVSDYKIKELQRTFVEHPEKDTCINVCFACDDNYAKHMGIVISSILRHKHKEDEFCFYVLDGGISDKNKKKIKSMMSEGNFSITYLKMDNSVFNNFPLKGSSHFTLATYYRLVLPSVLSNVDKLIYLDCDVVVKNSLRDLWKIDLGDNLCKGVIDVLHEENCVRLGIDKYVNAGVLLIDLNKWRKEGVEDKFKDYIKKNYEKILWNDQDVLNAVLQGRIDYLDMKWNNQLTECKGGETSVFRRNVKRASIIHFISGHKPWLMGKNKYAKIYYKEVLYSPWKLGYCKFLINMLYSFLLKFKDFIYSKRKTKTHKIYRILGFKFKVNKKIRIKTKRLLFKFCGLKLYVKQNRVIYLKRIFEKKEKKIKNRKDRILFISGITCIPDVNSMSMEECFYYVGGNTGNYVYKTYSKEYLVYDEANSVNVLDLQDLKRISNVDDNFDKIVIFCANQIRFGDNYLLQFYDFLNETKLPIVLLGLGVQSDVEYSTNFLNDIPEHVDFLNMLMRKNAYIGVRGKFSKYCLDLVGIASTVMGCPSYYRNGSSFYLSPKVANENIKLTLSLDLHWFKNREIWEKIICKYPKAQIVCQSKDEVCLYNLSRGIASAEDISKVKKLFNNYVDYRNDCNPFLNRCYLFFNVGEWENFVKTRDFYVGTRIHGCLMHILNGKPAMLIVHDSRTKEFAELFGIPFMYDSDLKENLDLVELYRKYSSAKMKRNYKRLLSNYKKFLNMAGIEFNFK